MLSSFRRIRAWHWAWLAAVCVGCSSESSSVPTDMEPTFDPFAQAAPSATPSATAPPPEPVDPELAKLLIPQGAKPSFLGSAVVTYLIETPVDATQEACRNLFIAEGWEPYGTAGDSQFFKRGLELVTADVAVAPAQDDKTMIRYSRRTMAVDLPAPRDATDLQYSDATRSINYDTNLINDELVEFYRAALAKAGWEATTKLPVEIPPRHVLIFRNPAKDMLTLSMYHNDGKNRVNLRFESAEQVAESDRRYKAQKEAREGTPGKPAPVVNLPIPAAADKLKQSETKLEFEVAAGTGKAVVEGWRKQLTADGWKERVITMDDKFGAVSFDLDIGQSLSVSFTDIGTMPAQITVAASGAKLAVPETK